MPVTSDTDITGIIALPLSLSDGGEGISQAISTITSTGSINALAPTTGLVILSGSGPAVNGIVAPSPTQARKITLLFTGSGSLTINSQSVLATAADRIITPANTSIRFYPNNSITLVYDDSATRWRFFSSNGAIYNTNTVTPAGILTIASTGGVQLITPATCDASGNLTTSGVLKSNAAVQSPYYQSQAGQTLIDTAFFTCFDASGILSVGFDGRSLWDATGSAQSVDWGARVALDSSSVYSVNWGNRMLVDSGGADSTDWSSRLLWATGPLLSLDWESRYLYANDGSTIVLNFSSQQNTTGTTAGFTQNGTNAVFDDSTFDGSLGGTAYTIGDIVLALKNYGLLAA